jgi:hypothetical protein
MFGILLSAVLTGDFPMRHGDNRTRQESFCGDGAAPPGGGDRLATRRCASTRSLTLAALS